MEEDRNELFNELKGRRDVLRMLLDSTDIPVEVEYPRTITKFLSLHYPCCGKRSWKYVKLSLLSATDAEPATTKIFHKDCPLKFHHLLYTITPFHDGVKWRFEYEWNFDRDWKPSQFSSGFRVKQHKRQCQGKCQLYKQCKQCAQCECSKRQEKGVIKRW